MPTKLDFDTNEAINENLIINDNFILRKLKQLCQAVDVINEKVQSLFDLYHKNFDEKGVIYGNIDVINERMETLRISQNKQNVNLADSHNKFILHIEKRLKDLEGRQRIAETLVALEDNGLLNKVGELSMQINMLKSDLREFEKQKVDPLRERLNILEECI